MMYGLRYVVIGIGTTDTPAEDEDCEAIKKLIERTLPVTATILDEQISDQLTSLLIRRAAGF